MADWQGGRTKQIASLTSENVNLAVKLQFIAGGEIGSTIEAARAQSVWFTVPSTPRRG